MVHHPWRRFRNLLPDWELISAPLPGGVLGGTDTPNRRIWLDSRMTQRKRRSTLDHELHHAEAGDVGCQHPKRERQINAMSARRLISVEDLLRVLAWANNPEEAAEELWVDLDTFNTRMQSLTPYELGEIRRIFNDRENREGA